MAHRQCFPQSRSSGVDAVLLWFVLLGKAKGRDTNCCRLMYRPQPPPITPEKAAELQQLVTEGLRLAVDSGPAGVRRSIQAAQVIFEVGYEYANTYLQGSTPARPAVVLRQLFEKLGATYIKLGQFIASSPSLFPEEYVTEFQKCLDQTDPVPFSQIRATVAAELSEPIDEVSITHNTPR